VDACQIPDYASRAGRACRLVTTLFGFLMQKGRIPDAWFAAQVEQADRVDGDIDTIEPDCAIRPGPLLLTPGLAGGSRHWRESRATSKIIVDALHERLTERSLSAVPVY